MKHLILATLLSVAAAIGFADEQADLFQPITPETDLKTFAWQNRLIVIFANSKEDVSFQTQIDFLKIDTEGHELNILKSFSFNVRPRSIKVEHRLTDDLAISEILRQENYLTWTEQNDIYAIG